MSKPRISYVDPTRIKDEAMLAEFDRCAREGTPRPESQAIRAHVPAVFWSFANSWRDVFKNGVADHAIKELCRIYVSRSVLCEFCGNQRSIKAAAQGIIEDDYRDLINFESSTRYDERQKAALSYAEAITWDLPVDDKFWARLHEHFSEPELVEIGYFVALTMGQQRWLRMLDIEHHQILAGTTPPWRPASKRRKRSSAPSRRPITGRRGTRSRKPRPRSSVPRTDADQHWCGGFEVSCHWFRQARVGTSNPKPHQKPGLASVPLIPKFASEGPQARANFGIGTLDGRRLSGGESRRRASCLRVPRSRGLDRQGLSSHP